MSSTLPASSTRQRTSASSTLAPNTDSAGVDHSRDGPQGKALKRQPTISFLNKLILASLAVSAFYIWRLSIQSTAAGGWWNLLTGHHPAEKTVAEQAASSRASAASAAQTGGAAAGPGQHHGAAGVPGIEQQILQLADSLGVKPRQLTEAIAPLLTPSLVSPDDPAFDDKSTNQAAEEEKGAAQAVGGALGTVGTILDTFAD